MMGNHYGGIPRTLRVGPFTFNVKVMAELPDDDLGGYSSSKLLITLARHLRRIRSCMR